MKEGLTTIDDLLDGYRKETVTLSSTLKDGRPKVFEIQSLSPGDFISVLGAPVLQTLLNEGASVEQIEASVDAKIEVIKQIVCLGVTSVTFVNKTQATCKKGEVSINRLSQEDIIELYEAIMRLSFPNQEAEMVKSFQAEGEQGSTA